MVASCQQNGACARITAIRNSAKKSGRSWCNGQHARSLPVRSGFESRRAHTPMNARRGKLSVLRRTYKLCKTHRPCDLRNSLKYWSLRVATVTVTSTVPALHQSSGSLRRARVSFCCRVVGIAAPKPMRLGADTRERMRRNLGTDGRYRLGEARSM